MTSINQNLLRQHFSKEIRSNKSLTHVSVSGLLCNKSLSLESCLVTLHLFLNILFLFSTVIALMSLSKHFEVEEIRLCGPISTITNNVKPCREKNTVMAFAVVEFKIIKVVAFR